AGGGQGGFAGGAWPRMKVAPRPDEAVRAIPTESMTDDAAPPMVQPQAVKKNPNYTAGFASELIELARDDRHMVGIPAVMPTGTGMSQFQAEYPDRFFDV